MVTKLAEIFLNKSCKNIKQADFKIAGVIQKKGDKLYVKQIVGQILIIFHKN